MLKYDVVSQDNDDVVFACKLNKREIDAQMLRQFSETNVQVNGFRPGHVPDSIKALEMRKRVGNKDYINQGVSHALEDLANHLVSSYEVKLLPDSGEVVETNETDEDGKTIEVQFKMSRDAEILREPDLKDIEKVEVKRLILDDEYVLSEMNRHYRSKAPLRELEDEKIEAGDMVTVSYGYIVSDEDEDKHTLRFDTIGKVNEQAPWLEVVKTQCVGASVGDTLTIEDHEVPVQWPRQDIRGKKLKLEIDVIKVERPELDDELNDDVAQDLGYENLEAWRTQVTAMMQDQVDKINLDAVHKAWSQAMIKIAKFHIPKAAMRRSLLSYADKMVPQPQDPSESAARKSRVIKLYSDMSADLEKEIEAKQNGEELDPEAIVNILERDLAAQLIRRYVMESWGDSPGSKDLYREIKSLIPDNLPEDVVEKRIEEFLDDEDRTDQAASVFRLRTGFEKIDAKHGDRVEVFEQTLTSQG